MGNPIQRFDLLGRNSRTFKNASEQEIVNSKSLSDCLVGIEFEIFQKKCRAVPNACRYTCLQELCFEDG
jgi:hypothetical protein